MRVCACACVYDLPLLGLFVCVFVCACLFGWLVGFLACLLLFFSSVFFPSLFEFLFVIQLVQDEAGGGDYYDPNDWIQR